MEGMEINATSGLLNDIESLNTEFSSQKDDVNLVNDKNITDDVCEDSTILEDQVNDKPQPKKSSLQEKETSSLEMAGAQVIQVKGETVIVGADVKALYPSLTDIEVAILCYKTVIETNISFENINYSQVMLVLCDNSYYRIDYIPGF